MRVFKSEYERKGQEEAWLAARGGKRPRPYGVYLWVCGWVCPYILTRTYLGLPKTIAPILKSPVILNPIKVLAIASVLIFTGCLIYFVLSGFNLRMLYWEIRWGKDKEKSLKAPIVAFLSLVVIEAFFGVFYLLDWFVAFFR